MRHKMQSPRYVIVRVPAWTGIRDIRTGETILTIQTRVDSTNSRDMRFLRPDEQEAREQLILDALNARAEREG